MIRSYLTLDMSATGYTPWIDVRGELDFSIQTDCGDVADPVGVITCEVSNDYLTIEAEQRAGTASASSAAVKVDYTSALTVKGSAWSNGYDGNGNKASYVAFPSGMPAFFRLKYTRTSGGSGDTLKIRTVGR